jgi:hypothetical protein
MNESLTTNTTEIFARMYIYIYIYMRVCYILSPLYVCIYTYIYVCMFAYFVKVKVTLRPTICRPARLGVRRPSGTRDQFLYLLENFF